MILRDYAYLPPEQDQPGVVSNERARRECGCTVYVGLRVDNREATTVAIPCSPAHRDLMDRFNLALGDSLVNPSRRTLIDVVDEILEGLK